MQGRLVGYEPNNKDVNHKIYILAMFSKISLRFHISSIRLPLNAAGVYFQTYLTSAFEAMTEALLLQHQVLELIYFCRHRQAYKIPNMLSYRSCSNTK